MSALDSQYDRSYRLGPLTNPTCVEWVMAVYGNNPTAYDWIFQIEVNNPDILKTWIVPNGSV